MNDFYSIGNLIKLLSYRIHRVDMKYIKGISSNEVASIRHPRVRGFRDATTYFKNVGMFAPILAIPHPIFVSLPEVYQSWLEGDKAVEFEFYSDAVKAFRRIRQKNPDEGVAVRTYIVGTKEPHLPGYRSSSIFDEESLVQAIDSTFLQAKEYGDIAQQVGIILHPFKNPGLNLSGEIITSCSLDGRVSRVAVVQGAAEGAHKITEVPEYLVLFDETDLGSSMFRLATKVLEYKKPELREVYVVDSNQLEIDKKNIEEKQIRQISLKKILHLTEELKSLEWYVERPLIVEFTVVNERANLIDFRDADIRNPVHGVNLVDGSAEEFILKYTGQLRRWIFRKNGRRILEDDYVICVTDPEM